MENKFKVSQKEVEFGMCLLHKFDDKTTRIKTAIKKYFGQGLDLSHSERNDYYGKNEIVIEHESGELFYFYSRYGLVSIGGHKEKSENLASLIELLLS